ncbi:serine--tRNA ligase [Rhizobium sp. Leaf384]|uniref:DUF1839 family protein n=1 Tax=unclassified Rhizobium TaxID=2613769 RepID=UPI0007158F01|nr:MULTISPECIES: DUF1839 family protein [unclassified Rhizobium]KQR76007.1 serine--tRNA ligase [Rhizobium sp. Leaf341]KQS76618.1 serine--tRNA ligase [Rhizobium sp. Leaf383]KQS77886.1 serine--tRNA ligase [Rhizobium sp. Leaf384]
MQAVFPGLAPETYRPHALHDQERMWPETNCYIDLWIEVLNTMNLPPEAMLGFTLTQDFEGDQFTFFKVPLEDLDTLYGITCTELAIFDKVERHVETQIARGRLCLVEMDSFFMPDTAGVAYRREHGKTTIGINRLDAAGRSLDYFHNGGFFRLEGDDFDGLFQTLSAPDALPLLPYTEFAKLPNGRPDEAHLRKAADARLAFHFARRPSANPFHAFAAVLPGQVEALAGRDFDFFHKYAFNTLRQFGANYELLATHLAWLATDGRYETERLAALKISEVGKTVQFQVARAVNRKRFDALAGTLTPAAEAWDTLMQGLATKLA